MSNFLSVHEKNVIMENRKLLLKKVRQHIDTELNPSKKTSTTSQGMTMKKLSQLMKSWKFWKFLSLIMTRHCQFQMVKIFKYTTEDHPTYVL